ncbi:DNA translocase FtsK [Cylas formicarius]|uniref:DNA translocase FtsK n=1 Tax=Cylas formicarius TaxID=197179 RepID=UPI0029589B9A|nr:DNA translocase FtsK [Cylas formicarius]
MFWINLLILLASLTAVRAASDNDITETPPPATAKLDSTLRKALLKALTELENEQESNSDVEKAQATSFTVLAKEEPASRNSTDDDEPATSSTLIFQKSDSLPATSVTTLEHQELDPVKDAERIITSATSGFTAKLDDTPISHNSIVDDEPETTTAAATTTSTEENEAKVEQVQLFSAPLVAAFTVHQDERGEPERVEPIFKTEKPKEEAAKELRDKQFAIEEEIQRLRLQQLRFKQQLLQREQLRFEPVFSEPTRSVVGQFVVDEQKSGRQGVAIDMFTANEAKPNPTISVNRSSTNATKIGAISLQPSISFDPLVDAGKLPVNGQLLPVKEAVNFHSPFVKDSAYKHLGVAHQGARIIQAQQLSGTNFFNPSAFGNVQTQSQTLPSLQPQLPTQQPSHQLTRQQPQLTFQSTQQVQTSPLQFQSGFQQAQQSPQTAFQPVQLAFHSLQQNPISPQKSQVEFQSGQSFQRQPQLAFQSGQRPEHAHVLPQPVFQTVQPTQQPQPAFQSVQPFGQAQLQPQSAFQPFQHTQSFPQQSQVTLGFDQSSRQTQPPQQQVQSFPTSNYNNLLTAQQQNRFHRQESGTGNFGRGFSIQQSSQPFPSRHEIGFFLTDSSRYNQNSAFLGPQHQQNNRFFRSNLESPQTVARGYFPQQRVNHQLNNLLVNSGFGGRSNEDLNIVAKVLSLNHARSDIYRNVPLVK